MSAPEPLIPLGRPVEYRSTGRASEVAEVTPSHCPECGAAWGPGTVQLGHSGNRTYRCAACSRTYVTDPTPTEDRP